MRKEEREMMGHCSQRYSLFANDYDRHNHNSDDLGFDYYNNHHFLNNGNANGNGNGNAITVIAAAASSSSTHSSPTTSPVSRRGVIEHSVSKMDTLAGVAIKYGVEVSDIKKTNGLVTDHQMFALKTLQIPLPGRHPPSPCLSNGSETPCDSNSENTPLQRRYSDLFDSFHSLRPKSRKVSSAMSSLQGYYGLSAGDPSQSLRLSPDSNPPLSHQRKSRSYVNVLLDENNGRDVADVDSMMRRRQKSEADFPKMLKGEENGNGGVVSAGITGKRLALRPKAASRSGLLSDFDTAGGLSPSPKQATVDSDVVDPVSAAAAVRKSSSTSSLNDTDGNGTFAWPSPKWSLRADLQALSAAAIGLPKPLSGWRNKAAVD
ncbi:LysM and putative peptidoglycan-binding domain-containing protein 1 [Linum perenne]